MAFGNRQHLLANDRDGLLRDEWTEQVHDVVGEVLERKKARDREDAEQRREQGEKEVVRQLRREPLRVVSKRLVECPLDQLPPRERHLEVRDHLYSEIGRASYRERV